MKAKQIFREVVVSVLIILWVYTAVSKFLDFKGFTYDMNNQPFPDGFTPVLVWLLPLSELAIAVALLSGSTRSFGLMASTVLLGIFTMYTGMVLLKFFPYTPCSCGGVIGFLTWPQHLAFNLLFTALSYAGWKSENKFRGNETEKNLSVHR